GGLRPHGPRQGGRTGREGHRLAHGKILRTDAMKTRATARYVRVPASKARLVLEHIRGKSAGEALATLAYTPKAAARLIEKVLRSAIPNAEHNHQGRDLDDLRAIKATAARGPAMN